MGAAGPLVHKVVVRRKILNWELVRITHAAEENRLSFRKRTQQSRRLVVPLAGHKGRIPGAREHLGPSRLALQVRLDAEKRPSSHEHGTGRYADGSLLCAHAISTGEGCPFLHEAIEVRRLDMGVAECGDG